MLGRDVMPQEFLQNPEIQQQSMGAKLESALQHQIQAGHNIRKLFYRRHSSQQIGLALTVK